ncbi:antirestriction protein [Pseudomaricurvus alcaniphilus]|uniref:antirestriction protein n=1 Tax=Pseudomaricurvus alcaniphilus TaxID=1166482 RepID=UPI00140CA794|nr:antirestriction protein [Pseudomaricurvus alcaniphilus]NHN38965.1 antirestriction protein [Pseudomaricurvus alcaniphilus]
MNTDNNTITRTLVPEDQRLDTTARLFDHHFPLAIEPTIYAFADRLSEGYRGGYWLFYTLSSGGFYMAPESDTPFQVTCDNGYEGELSADAFGITVCLYAYSHLSFHRDIWLSELCANHYHWLRECMLEHPEARVILAAVD